MLRVRRKPAGVRARCPSVLAAAATLCLALLPGGYAGETYTWDGTTAPHDTDNTDDPIFGPAQKNALVGTGTQDNTITVNSDYAIKLYGVYGGSGTGAVTGNTVNIGGTAYIGNTVFDDNTGTVAGGYSSGGDVIGNRVNITGGQIGTTTGVPNVFDGVTGVYGGRADGAGATVRDNHVVVDAGTIYKRVYGGFADNGAAVTQNTVTINGGDLDEVQTVIGGNNLGGSASNNEVIVTGGDMNEVWGGGSGRATGTGIGGAVTGNKVTISGGAMTNAIGGRARASNANNVTGNTVVMTDGAIKAGVAGDANSIRGGWANSGAATGNTVTISGGTINQHVVIQGGHANAAGGSATGNTVNISGGTFAASDVTVYGGSTYHANAATAFGGSTGNTVNISNAANGIGTATLAGVNLYGGNSTYAAADVRTGNTLNFDKYILPGTQINSIRNFAAINIAEIPASVASGSATPLIDNAAHDFVGGNTILKVGGINANSALTTGDTINVINDAGTGLAYQGKTIQKGLGEIFRVTYAGGIMTLGGRSANPNARFLSLGRMAGVAFLDRGADMIVDSGYNAIRAAFGPECVELCPKFTTFAAVGGAWGKVDYGTHDMDVDGVNFMAGAAYRVLNGDAAPSYVFGVFAEGGYGDYDSGIRADGDTHYWGGGLMARVDAPNGFYAEASGRVGRMTQDFSSRAINATRTHYGDTHSTYYGLHAGLGYLASLGRSSLDFSAKYFWTHIGDKNTTVAGERVKYDAIDSHRVRAGVRWGYNTDGCVMPYVGAAYEYQFSAKGKTTLNGLKTPENELKGSTGIVEAGVRLVNRGRFSADLGGHATFGRREDYGVNLFLGCDF